MPKQLCARKDGKLIVVSMAPDVCKTPMGNAVVPVPYPVTIDLSGSNNYSTDVNFNDNQAFRFNTDTTKVIGDEAGTAGGVKSGTTGQKAEPIQHSASVKINKEHLIRCGDMFYMNNKNTQGRLVCVPPPPQAHISDDGQVTLEIEITNAEKSWYESAWDNITDAADSVVETAEWTWDKAVELDQKYQIVTRVEGAAVGAFGVVEIVGGAAGIVAPEPATTAGGVLLLANGADNAQAGFRQLWTGKPTETLVETGVGMAAETVGVDPTHAQIIVDVAGIVASPGKAATKADDLAEGAIDIARKKDKIDDLPKKPKNTNTPDKPKDTDAPEKSKNKDKNKDKDDGSESKKEEDNQVKGKNKTKNKGNCAESLVNEKLLEEGWEQLSDSELLTNGSGHGFDHVMIKDGKLLIAETKADAATLSDIQKNSTDYINKQIKDLETGIMEGKGRYKNLMDNEKASDALEEIKGYLENGDIETRRYQVKLEPDDTGDYGAENKENCKSKGKFPNPKKW